MSRGRGGGLPWERSHHLQTRAALPGLTPNRETLPASAGSVLLLPTFTCPVLLTSYLQAWGPPPLGSLLSPLSTFFEGTKMQLLVSRPMEGWHEVSTWAPLTQGPPSKCSPVSTHWILTVK